jgi:NADPH:quinone reductase-like Zn-dependent oxidoreductase
MNESPALMRAVGYNANLPADDPASLLDVEDPVPALQPHDLLVEVHAVSVNPLGFGAAGIVRDVGEAVTLFEPGDEVFYAGHQPARHELRAARCRRTHRRAVRPKSWETRRC